jgi:hypothetical protein
MLAMGYAGQEVTVSVHPAAERQAAPALAFVRPHFSVVPCVSGAGASLSVEILPLSDWRQRTDAGEQTRIRVARTHTRHVWASRWRAGGRTTIAVESSRTVFDLADDGSAARIHVSDTSRYHLSDLLRDVMWELASAGGNGRFIHAAAVSDGRAVVAFTGSKGAGKTTTALDFVHAGAGFYSGDILFLDSDGAAVHSFPDYPGVCWGTLRAFPRLFDAAVGLGLTPSPNDGQKVLLPHDFYRTALGVRKVAPPLPLCAVIAPDIAAPGDARLVPAPPGYEHFAAMSRHTSGPGEGWEPFLAAVAGRAAGSANRRPGGAAMGQVWPKVPWYARLGRGRLPVEDIGRVLDTRVPTR